MLVTKLFGFGQRTHSSYSRTDRSLWLWALCVFYVENKTLHYLQSWWSKSWRSNPYRAMQYYACITRLITRVSIFRACVVWLWCQKLASLLTFMIHINGPLVLCDSNLMLCYAIVWTSIGDESNVGRGLLGTSRVTLFRSPTSFTISRTKTLGKIYQSTDMNT